MIVANLATYPPRFDSLLRVAAAIAPQVHRLNIVLNEYSIPIDELTSHPNVHQIIPDQDTKDTGKFLIDVADAEYVLLIDDDIGYPQDYVEETVRRFRSLGSDLVYAGYHATFYSRPSFGLAPKDFFRWATFRPSRYFKYRKTFKYTRALQDPKIVAQLGSGTVIMKGRDVPTFDAMRDAQKFVDVRLAKLCHMRGITPVALPRSDGWLTSIQYEETIYRGFTVENPPHVASEISSYAFNVPGSGQTWTGSQ